MMEKRSMLIILLVVSLVATRLSAGTGSPARAPAPPASAKTAVSAATPSSATSSRTAASSSGPALPSGVEKTAAVEGITEYHLANGLRVLLFPDPSTQTTTVNITY